MIFEIIRRCDLKDFYLGAVVENYLTIEELAKYLKYSEKTIRKWVLNRQIPFHKIHKTIRFRLTEIEKWIDCDCVHLAGEETEVVKSAEMFNEETASSLTLGIEGAAHD